MIRSFNNTKIIFKVCHKTKQKNLMLAHCLRNFRRRSAAELKLPKVKNEKKVLQVESIEELEASLLHEKKKLLQKKNSRRAKRKESRLQPDIVINLNQKSTQLLHREVLEAAQELFCVTSVVRNADFRAAWNLMAKDSVDERAKFVAESFKRLSTQEQNQFKIDVLTEMSKWEQDCCPVKFYSKELERMNSKIFGKISRRRKLNDLEAESKSQVKKREVEKQVHFQELLEVA
jgi:hypothetical protein